MDFFYQKWRTVTCHFFTQAIKQLPTLKTKTWAGCRESTLDFPTSISRNIDSESLFVVLLLYMIVLIIQSGLWIILFSIQIYPELENWNWSVPNTSTEETSCSLNDICIWSSVQVLPLYQLGGCMFESIGKHLEKTYWIQFHTCNYQADTK